jgi:serine kinase of HPr protein (carbohydrate metabolism regulator)
MSANLLHATAIAIGGNGILLLGPSASGKSDLALRMIDRGALLISDDAVPVDVSNAPPLLTAAPNIEGKLEVRGVGICSVAFVRSAPLRLAARLSNEVERIPASRLSETICGFVVPLVRIAPFEVSAAIKLEFALRSVVDADLWPVAIAGAHAPESRTI